MKAIQKLFICLQCVLNFRCDRIHKSRSQFRHGPGMLPIMPGKHPHATKSATPETLPDNVFDAVKLAQRLMAPWIGQLLYLVATFSVTTCSCEGSISALRRLKTYIRSTMGQERLNGLALLHSHYTFQVDIDDVIKRFFIKYPRRIVCPVTVCDELNVCGEDTDDKEKSSDTLSDNRFKSARSDVEEDIVEDSI